MENIMEFLREKFYYVIGVFGLLLIVLIVVFSCSNTEKMTNYQKMEYKMIEGAKKYYNNNKKELPKTEADTASINLSYLVENKYVKKIKDPEKKKSLCSGKVETTKRGNDYKYVAILKCKNYNTKFLNAEVKKNLKLDAKGNGLYVVGDEYIFRGESLKNYVIFDKELWQIMRVDAEGDVKLIKDKTDSETYTWDDRYNATSEGKDGINNFSLSRMKDTLNKYYIKNFNTVEGAKANIVKKQFCVGTRSETDDLKGTAECSIKDNLYVGLIYVSEFYMASIDSTCTKFGQEQCANYNYLAKNKNSSWTLTGSKERTSRVYGYYEDIFDVDASNSSRIYPVIYLDSKTTISSGNGSYTDPYVIR